MKSHLFFATLFCLCGLVDSAIAVDPNSAGQWERSNAMAAVRSVNVDRAVYEIGNSASLADGEATLARLRDIETRSDWPLPAREAALYEFTRSLAELPRAAVAAEVMQHLKNYQAQTLVPQEEHQNSLVPLFNIRGAAAGVENGWQRTEFGVEAFEILGKEPSALVSAYIKSSNHNQRAAYLDTLRQAGLDDVQTVQNAALDQLAQAPVLTPVVGLTAAITMDRFAIQQLLTSGSGAGLSPALNQLDKRLHTSDTADLLTYAILEAPADNASLAIAAWWPRLRHEAAIRDLLLDRLADPALGAAAALALAQSPDIQTIKLLQDAAAGHSLAARRAQMALDINRERLLGEVQP